MKQLPLKLCEGDSEKLGRLLQSFAKDNFTGEDAKVMDSLACEAGRLRKKIQVLTNDHRARGEGSDALPVFQSYLSCLLRLKQLFPFGSDSGGGMFKKAERVAYEFTWSDAFLQRDIPMTLSYNVDFEIACILYCIASCHSIIALGCDHTTVDGSRAAAQSFLRAAGVLEFLDVHAIDYSFSEASPDMRLATFRWGKEFMIAQASIMTFEQARYKSMSADTISKLAAGCSMKFGELETLFTLKDNAWLSEATFPYVKYAKYEKLMFSAAASYHASRAEFERENFNLEIARLRQAQVIIDSAKKVEPAVDGLKMTRTELSGIIAERLRRAEDDNTKIYGYSIPAVETLPPIEPKLLGAPIAFELPKL
jgi:programmed cell death 6-interacting protein